MIIFDHSAIKRIITTLAVALFATAPLHAAIDEDDLSPILAAWKDSDQRITVVDHRASIAQLIVTVTYSREGLIEASDRFGITLAPPSYGFRTSSTLLFRTGLRGCMSGNAQLREVGINGFKVNLRLSWTHDIPPQHFNHTFPAKWIPEQSFEQDDFTVKITLSRPRAGE